MNRSEGTVKVVNQRHRIRNYAGRKRRWILHSK
jgi:hypothetical protein